MRIRSAILLILTIASGFVLASGVAAALFAMLGADIRLFTPAFVVISIVGVGIGLPIYLLVRANRHDNAIFAGIAGFVVGAVIPALIVVFGPAADQASVGGTATVVNGSYTAAGWLQNLKLVGFFGALGACGGLLFWFVVRRGASNEIETDATEQTVSPVRTVLVATAAAGVIFAAFLIPSATKDRSCHNPLRNGGDSIRAQATFDLKVGPDQWRNVAIETQAFGRSGNWNVMSDLRPDDSFQWLQISLCKEPGTNISINGMPDFNQVSFVVYQPQGGNSWRDDFNALYQRIHARWPGQVTFNDGQGRTTSMPDWAKGQDAP